jgi:dienelactone hydrolase
MGERASCSSNGATADGYLARPAGAGRAEHVRCITGKPVGTVGFCMGGALSLFAARVVYYGIHPKVRWDFDALTAPVLGHWAENDPGTNAIERHL